MKIKQKGNRLQNSTSCVKNDIYINIYIYIPLIMDILGMIQNSESYVFTFTWLRGSELQISDRSSNFGRIALTLTKICTFYDTIVFFIYTDKNARYLITVNLENLLYISIEKKIK